MTEVGNGATGKARETACTSPARAVTHTATSTAWRVGVCTPARLPVARHFFSSWGESSARHAASLLA
eukprot:4170703-Heterocapsa_arctica.AAC.1